MTDEGPEAGPAGAAEMVDPPHPELVIGLVTPIGTNTADFALRVRGRLPEWGYGSEIIHISDGLDTAAPTGEHEDERVERLIDAGNAWCADKASPFGLGQLFLEGIRDRRISVHRRLGDTVTDPTVLGETPVPKMAYILHSLKRPGAVELLRDTYGSLFLLLGCQTSLQERLETLSRRLESRLFWDEEQRRNRALELINRDEEESGDYGQTFGRRTPSLTSSYRRTGIQTEQFDCYLATTR